MRLAALYTGFIACLILNSACGKHHKKEEKVEVQTVQKSAVETTTEVTEEEITEVIETETATEWREYFLNNYESWRSCEKQSDELRVIVKECFTKVVSGHTFWEKLTKNSQYVEFVAAATGYTGSCTEISKVKSHCLSIATSKPRLLALAFKSISKHVKNSNSKLKVCELAKKRYKIGEKEIAVKKSWKINAIQQFINYQSSENLGKKTTEKVLNCLKYDEQYFNKLLEKKIYAEYLGCATDFKGNIKHVQELKSHLMSVAHNKPQLAALALKYLCKNLKNPKVPLTISKTAVKIYGIKEKTITKVDWKTKLITEYYSYKSTQKYKEQDQILRVKSILNFDADGCTVLDLLLKRKEYRKFFAESIGYEYKEASFDEKHFREYVATYAEVNPTLLSLSFRSICKNLKDKQELKISHSAQKIIEEIHKSNSNSKTIKKTKKKTTKTTTVTKTWEELLVKKFAVIQSESDSSNEINSKIEEFISYNANGYSCLEKILKTESYAEYLAYTTAFKGKCTDTKSLTHHIKTVAKNKPRLLASCLKYVGKNIENSQEKLVVSRVAIKNGVVKKEFNVKKCWKKRVTELFISWNSESCESSELKQKLVECFKYDTASFENVLQKKEYLEYFAASTGYKGKKDVTSVKTYFSELCSSKPRLVALSLKYFSKHLQNKNEKLVISQTAIKKYHIEEKEIVKTDWTSYACQAFTNIDYKNEKAHNLRAKCEKLVSENDGVYLKKIVCRSVYAEYLAKMTDYKGDVKKTEEFIHHIKQQIEKQPRRVSCAFSYITKNQKDSSSKLVIETFSESTSETSTKKTESTAGWTTYAFKAFSDLDYKNEKAHNLKAKCKKLVSENGGVYLKNVVKNHEYAEYLCKMTGYTGNTENTEEIIKYINEQIDIQPREVSCAFTHITKHQKDSSSKLVIETFSESTTESTASWTVYAYKAFSDLDYKNEKAHNLKAKCKKLVSENGGVYLKNIVKNQKYAEYLRKMTEYKGDIKNHEEFINYINQQIEKQPRRLSCAFTYITKNQKNSSSKLTVETISETTQSNTNTSGSSCDVVTYLKQFKDCTETTQSSELKSRCENFRVAQNGAALHELLKNEEVVTFLKKITRYSGQDNITEFYNFLVNNFCNQRSRFAALAFKQIYFHLSSNAQLETPQYCKTFWEKEEKSTKRSSSSSGSKSTTSTKTVSKTVKEGLFKFSTVKSEIGEKTTAVTTCNSFIQHSYLDEILKNEEYARYLGVNLEYTDYKNIDGFKSYIRKTILVERPLALALCLKKIYFNVNENQRLVTPSFVSSEYKISTTEYCKTSSYSETSSSSSKTTTSTGKSSSSSSSSSSESDEDK
ncbi:uncharacterized protein LOC142332001 isoform X1 [Lycorma delicatula]|uniref:uncharacterized protein LOC142332001 isoform X1 n=1 Tax=Lycorma delicatula TaxID=130591 RepID=UPI003F50DEE4